MVGLVGEIDAALPEDLPEKIAVAVSGGGDSVALLLGLHALAPRRGARLFAVTVDHQLRPAAAEEAQWVAALCARLGVPHEILNWTGWDGAGNLQHAARQARYKLMADWAISRGISQVALGHTMDDQAETVLMQLARSAGVDGLSAMIGENQNQGITWIRPLLGLRRQALRSFLVAQCQTWIEDPSNDDSAFDRIRIRRMLGDLAGVGIDVPGLAQVAQNMQGARTALELQTTQAAQSIARISAGGVCMDGEGFEGLPDEIARRLLASAVRWIGASDYAPRGKSLRAACDALQHKGSATLAGCFMLKKTGHIWIVREFNAVRHLRCTPEQLWDGRWRLSGPGRTAGLQIAALGETGLAHCPDWRATGLPRQLLLASPAVWQGEQLQAAPTAGWANGWQLICKKDKSGPIAAAISH